jgi:hypothetical protein
MPVHQCLLHNDWIINWCLGADQDSVRLLAVEGCAALGKLLEPADCVTNILPVIVDFSQVRCVLNPCSYLQVTVDKNPLVHCFACWFTLVLEVPATHLGNLF